jgi:hypothetical protein
MAKEFIQLEPIEAVSPTLAETLRQCKLRAGLSRAEGARQHVLGNPKAWLGTAYHAVLEAVRPQHGNDIDARVHHLWSAAIEKQYERSRIHPFDRRFGPPESWPGYHMVAAMALARAKELVLAGAKQNSSARNDQTGGATVREKKFSGADGKMVGRPDVVRPEEVVDFKTGEVFEDEDQEQVKDAYVRQLRLYAFLVKETLGWWPRRGILLPMAGSPVSVALEPDECEADAAEAIRLLNEYNEVLAQGSDPIDLASPSPTNCRWCQYQLYCPAFWSEVSPDWSNELRTAAVVGSATGAATPIHSGAAVSLSLAVERGTVPAGEFASLFPLDPAVHQSASQVQAGDQVRVTGLWRRHDDSVVATKWTMIAIETVLPEITVRPEEIAGGPE